MKHGVVRLLNDRFLNTYYRSNDNQKRIKPIGSMQLSAFL